MAELKALAILATVLALLGSITASNLCPKALKSSKVRPTMPEKYSTSYEFTSAPYYTTVFEEEYDGINSRFSFSKQVQGITEYVYETGGLDKQLFNITSDGVCHEMVRKDLLSWSIFPTLRKTVQYTKDKNFYLKFLVDLPKAYLIGYKGTSDQKDLNRTVDDWEFCIDGIMINIYWTIADENTRFPIKVSVTYQNPTVTESLYIFKYIRNEVNETALEPPAHIYCPGRFAKRALDMTPFFGPDMQFTSEVVDPELKEIYTTEHSYAMDEGLAAITTPDPDPKHPHQSVLKVNYVFDFNLGYFFKVTQSTQKCEAHSIDSYQGKLGDVFDIYEDMFRTPLSKRSNYFYTGQDIRRGIITDVYKGLRKGYPIGMTDTSSVINWYVVNKNKGDTVPVALEYFYTKDNGKGTLGPVTGKLLLNLFDWKKLDERHIVETSNSDFGVYSCAKGFKEMSFVLNVEKQSPRQNVIWEMLKRQLRIHLAKAANISPLRLNGIYVSGGTSSKSFNQNLNFYLLNPFTDVPASNVSISNAFLKIKKVIDSGKFTFKVLAYDKKNATYAAVKNSLKYGRRNEATEFDARSPHNAMFDGHLPHDGNGMFQAPPKHFDD